MTYNNTKKGCTPACQDGNKYAIEPKNRCSTMVTAMYLFWHHRTIPEPLIVKGFGIFYYSRNGFGRL